MNVNLDNLRDVATKPKWAHSGVGKTLETAERAAEILNSPEYRALADKTDIDEAKRELLQASPLEMIESLEGASEAEVDEAIQKVEEEAMKAEESREEAEINAVGQIADEAAELEEPIEFEAQPANEVKVETQTDLLGPSSTIKDVPATAASPAAEVAKQPPAAQTQEEILAASTLEVIPLEVNEATSVQSPLAGSSETTAPAREEEPRPETAPQDKTTTQTTPEVAEAQKAEAEVETEVKKVAEETAVDGTTREDASEPKPEKKD